VCRCTVSVHSVLIISWQNLSVYTNILLISYLLIYLLTYLLTYLLHAVKSFLRS